VIDRVSGLVRQAATRTAILAGYDALADIYGHVPPLIMWRAWEYAIYRRYELAEPVLDLGCGDGRFFQRVFPHVREVIGVDEDPAVVALGRESGVYRAVHLAPAHRIPEADGRFASAFANCSLEHMSFLDDVLAEMHRVLKPGASVLVSVVSDTFVRWAPLQTLMAACGAAEAGNAAQARHEAYHHLVNPFPLAEWVARFERAGFEAVEWVPMIEGAAGWTFLLLDQLWHMPQGVGEFGERMHRALVETPDSVAGNRLIFDGLLSMSRDSLEHAGLVLWLRKAV
jgi:SAM-dependent methyltransferase